MSWQRQRDQSLQETHLPVELGQDCSPHQPRKTKAARSHRAWAWAWQEMQPEESDPPIFLAFGSTFSLGSRPRAVSEVWSGNPSEATLPANVYGFIIASRSGCIGVQEPLGPRSSIMQIGPMSSRAGI